MQQALIETDSLVAALASTLKQSEMSLADLYIIKTVETEWPRDPFFTGRTLPVERVEREPDMLEFSFVYTGYMERGDRVMAIINGVDYRAGEAMEVPGYVLRSISPRQVVIEYEDGRRRITVPFVEE